MNRKNDVKIGSMGAVMHKYEIIAKTDCCHIEIYCEKCYEHIVSHSLMVGKLFFGKSMKRTWEITCECEHVNIINEDDYANIVNIPIDKVVKINSSDSPHYPFYILRKMATEIEHKVLSSK